MENTLRLTCPSVHTSKEERIDELFEGIARWIESEEMARALALFEGDLPHSLSLKKKIEHLNDFVEVWDYRNKQGQTRERWSIENTGLDACEAEEIMSIAANLGLTDTTKPLIVPDYILPLGGARLTNLNRPRYASEISRSMQNPGHKVVALGSMRPIDSIERSTTDSYAPMALTEYDALCTGMEQAFSLEDKMFIEDIHEDQNANLSWAIRKYAHQELYVAAAPSLLATRRANSIDTFCFFLEKFNIKEGEKILLVTNCIYVPFQFLKFMDIALEHNLLLDCVGTPYTSTKNVLEPTHYLQEIKATVNAMKSLADTYL